jgi:hypothetical protein
MKLPPRARTGLRVLTRACAFSYILACYESALSGEGGTETVTRVNKNETGGNGF